MLAGMVFQGISERESLRQSYVLNFMAIYSIVVEILNFEANISRRIHFNLMVVLDEKLRDHQMSLEFIFYPVVTTALFSGI